MADVKQSTNSNCDRRTNVSDNGTNGSGSGTAISEPPAAEKTPEKGRRLSI